MWQVYSPNRSQFPSPTAILGFYVCISQLLTLGVSFLLEKTGITRGLYTVSVRSRLHCAEIFAAAPQLRLIPPSNR